MSRYSVVIQGSAIAGFRARIAGRIALGAMLCAAWTGCGNAPPGVNTAQQAVTCTSPGSGASTSAWTTYGICLTPDTTCLATITAKVWQSGTNKITISTPPNQLEVDLTDQDNMEAAGKRPLVWRHPPTTPAELNTLLSPPMTTDAQILVQPSIATTLGFTPGTLTFKWPDCTAPETKLPVVELSPATITLTGSGSVTKHTIGSGGSGARDLTFPNLVVRVHDDGATWPNPISRIDVTGSIPSGSSTINLLDEKYVPRPQVIDLTTSPAKVALTQNGRGRFPP